MSTNRWFRCAAVLATTGLAASAKAQNSGNPPATPAPKASQNTEQPAAASPAYLLNRLAGEWQGDIQSRQGDGMVSASLATISNRYDPAKKSMTSCFEGFAFGKPVEGAAFWRTGEKSGHLSHSLYSSVLSKTLRCTGATSCQTSSLSFGGPCPDVPGKDAERVEQSIQMKGENQFTAEWWTVKSDGSRTCLLKFDMTRMAAGQKSQAAAGFENRNLLARVQSPASSATVSANESR